MLLDLIINFKKHFFLFATFHREKLSTAAVALLYTKIEMCNVLFPVCG